MTQKQEIEAEIARLESQLAILNSVPEDTFFLGTIALFSANDNTTHWYYVKTGEENWTSLKGGSPGNKPLNEWILAAHESDIGYFEVYEMRTQEPPFYASA